MLCKWRMLLKWSTLNGMLNFFLVLHLLLLHCTSHFCPIRTICSYSKLITFWTTFINALNLKRTASLHLLLAFSKLTWRLAVLTLWFWWCMMARRPASACSRPPEPWSSSAGRTGQWSSTWRSIRWCFSSTSMAKSRSGCRWSPCRTSRWPLRTSWPPRLTSLPSGVNLTKFCFSTFLKLLPKKLWWLFLVCHHSKSSWIHGHVPAQKWSPWSLKDLRDSTLVDWSAYSLTIG